MSQAAFIGKENSNGQHSFRDSLSTVDASGGRIWLYPKNPKGKYTSLRTLLACLFLAALFVGPYIQMDGEPILLLNIVERKFIIFGTIFWPQDFHIFLLVMLAFMVFVILFTVVYGRVFCGWICPQTIFMESVFRKIEYWIEGDYKTRMLLDKAPLSVSKFFKKLIKHLVFFIVALIIANTFLSYIIGADAMLRLWTDHPLNHTGNLAALMVFTFVFYWIYAKFREQVCTTVCPYGRLQGVLLDKRSLMVIYDYVRGEHRGKLKAHEERSEAGKGDCIDCHQCVDVCPVGIDIRNGTQMECTNCTACMDACDFMMAHTGLKKGLIRIDSEERVSGQQTKRLTARMVGYTVILVALMGFIVSMLAMRTDVETSVLRMPGSLFQTMPNNQVSNLYTIKLINKTSRQIPVQVKMLSDEGEVKLIGKSLVIPAQGSAQTAAFIIMNRSDIEHSKTRLTLGIYHKGVLLETVSTTFIGPVNHTKPN